MKPAESIAKFHLRFGRGDSLLTFFKEILQAVVYLGAFSYIYKNWFGVALDKYLVIGLALSYIIICYFVGAIDERVGFWRYENRYSSKELNPFLEELNSKIDILLKK